MTADLRVSPYLERVTGVEGAGIGTCENCGRHGLTVLTALGEDSGIICIPTIGCRNDAWTRRAHPEVFLRKES